MSSLTVVLPEGQRFFLPRADYYTPLTSPYIYTASRINNCRLSPLESHTQTQQQKCKMSETKEFTYEEVSSHNTKKDLYLVIHDKVYNSSSFVDEHP